MLFKALPEPVLVSSQRDLLKLCNVLSGQSQVAVDTEANSLYAYQEKVCLIQFSIPETDYLVDPIKLDDLSPLGTIFNHPKIEKIFHAAEYDLIVLKHDFGFSFNCLFDTMLAARILGWTSVGLSSILKSIFGVEANKKYQRANWGRRPLSREMLTYAQLDTHYLIPLRNLLKSELEKSKRWKLAEEDFRRVSLIGTNDHNKKPVNCWRINGVQDLTPRQVAVLQELCEFRDQKARALDRPLFKVISDRALVRIAVAMPVSLAELEQVPGISQKQARWLGKGLLAAVQRGLNREPPSQPRSTRLSEQHMKRIDRLMQWRKSTARRLNVESDVVLPKDLLLTLAKNNPQNQGKMEEILVSVPWRVNKFGDEIFNLLRTSKS